MRLPFWAAATTDQRRCRRFFYARAQSAASLKTTYFPGFFDCLRKGGNKTAAVSLGPVEALFSIFLSQSQRALRRGFHVQVQQDFDSRRVAGDLRVSGWG